jgi:hypothetical protein
MPYGVDKELGGDNKANTKFMEACVKAVKGQKSRKGIIDEASAIMICKSTLKKHLMKQKKMRGK